MITMEQALTADEFHNDGPYGRPCNSRQGPVKWRRKGKTQTQARRPEYWLVPVKWGLKSHDYITSDRPDVLEHMHTAEDCPVEQASREAAAHGHPEWSHLMAHGPCTVQPAFEKAV